MFGFRSRQSAESPSAQSPDSDAPVSAVRGVVERGQHASVPELDGRKVLTRFLGVVARIPRYVKMSWALMNDQTVTGRGKAALAGGLAYAISPIDPVPGFIPVIGQLDDLAILLLAVRAALKSAPAEVAERHLQEAGLSWETLERDLVTLRATTIWLMRRGGKLAAQAGRAIVSMATSKLRDALPGAGRARTGATVVNP
jgi:uncharacterized membrane protein YkvA (DUF1232 family)